MAFLQRKTVFQLSPETCLLLHTQRDPATQLLGHTFRGEDRESPRAPAQRSGSCRPQHASTAAGNAGPCPARRCEAPGRLPGRSRSPTCRRAGTLPRLPGFRARPRPPPPARRLLPRRSGLPRDTAGGGRRRTPPALLPQHRAPRRPSGLGQAVIGGIPTPGCRGERRWTPGPVLRRHRGKRRRRRRGPRRARHPPLSAPAWEKGELSRARLRSRPGKALAPPTQV